LLFFALLLISKEWILISIKAKLFKLKVISNNN